jgi:hypothetical protein
MPVKAMSRRKTAIRAGVNLEIMRLSLVTQCTGVCFIKDRQVSFAIPQGLKPLVFKALFGTTKQAAEKPLIPGNMSENRPSVAKATTDSNGFTRGLKPPSPSELSFSAACKAVS